MTPSDLKQHVLSAVRAAGFRSVWGDGHSPTKSEYRIYLIRSDEDRLRVSIAFTSLERLTGAHVVVSLAPGSQHSDNKLDHRQDLLAWAAAAVLAAASVTEPELAARHREELDASADE